MADRRDSERLDWLDQQLRVHGQEAMLDLEILVPDEGGPEFLGVTLYLGPRGNGGRLVGGAAMLREAIDEAMEKTKAKRKRRSGRATPAQEEPA